VAKGRSSDALPQPIEVHELARHAELLGLGAARMPITSALRDAQNTKGAAKRLLTFFLVLDPLVTPTQCRRALAAVIGPLQG